MSRPPAGLRILQLVHAAQRRGAEVFASDLSAALRGRGHHVETWALHRGDASLAVERVLGLIERNVIERFVGVDPRGLRQLASAVAAFRPDVIQLNGASTVKYGAALGALTPGRRWRLVYRNIGSPGFWLRSRGRRVFYRHAVMPQMDGIVALTAEIAAELQRIHRLRSPVMVIPNAISPARVLDGADRAAARARWNVSPSTPVVAFVGALSAEKAPDRFVDVVEQIESAVGWMVGDGPLRLSLQQRAARSGRILLHGHIDHIGAVLSGADVLVCPSDSEGIPAAILEAGLLGIPTVAFKVGGLAACVQHRVTGLLVEPGDIAGLIEAVRALAGDPVTRRDLGEAARRMVEEHFTIDQVTARFEAFYRQTAEATA